MWPAGGKVCGSPGFSTAVALVMRRSPYSMIPKSGNRFSEKHALGLDPRDHAQTKSQSGITIRKKVIPL
jgi:hypothetical protein